MKLTKALPSKAQGDNQVDVDGGKQSYKTLSYINYPKMYMEKISDIYVSQHGRTLRGG